MNKSKLSDVEISYRIKLPENNIKVNKKSNVKIEGAVINVNSLDFAHAIDLSGFLFAEVSQRAFRLYD